MSTVGIRRPNLTAPIAGALLASTLACATNPVTGKREFNLMSEAQEIQIGQQMDPEVEREFGVYRDAELQAYVDNVAMTLARASQRPNLPWKFTVVDPPVVNAFALPGGFIYITRGLLAHLNDEAELAGVLGHEIGHVTARHAAQQYSKATGASLGMTLGMIFIPGMRPYGQLADLGLNLLFLKYSRDDELQADRLGATYAADRGWDPQGVPDLLTTLARLDEQRDRRGVPSYLLTHPEPGARAARIQETVVSLRTKIPDTSLQVNREPFLRAIDGMWFGDNPREGVVRGSEFLHPDLRFAMQFPDGWEIVNSKEQVGAKAPGADAFMLLEIVQGARGSNLQDLALSDMRRAGFRPVEGGVTNLNGLTAFVGTFQGSMRNLGNVVARVAHIAVGRSVFRVAGFGAPAIYTRFADEISRSLRTFRELSRQEAENIRPNQIDLYTVRSGDTWQSIAQGIGGNNVKASTLAIINGFPVSEQPRAGDRIKVVIPGTRSQTDSNPEP
jgi:predicted Zn-dependent protease